jgi:hypothetical protein
VSRKLTRMVFPAALIALLVLGFAVNEARKPDDLTADRIRHQCALENITEAQVKECRFRLTWQKPNDERLSQLQIRRQASDFQSRFRFTSCRAGCAP